MIHSATEYGFPLGSSGFWKSTENWYPVGAPGAVVVNVYDAVWRTPPAAYAEPVVVVISAMPSVAPTASRLTLPPRLSGACSSDSIEPARLPSRACPAAEPSLPGRGRA